MREKVSRWARLMIRMMAGLMVRRERRLPTAISWTSRSRIAPTSQMRRNICVRNNHSNNIFMHRTEVRPQGKHTGLLKKFGTPPPHV